MIVGFVGLGTMGAWMAHHLLKAGHTVFVYNRTTEKMNPLLQAGAKPGASPEELGEQCDLVVVCVSDAPDVEEVILGKQGISKGMKPGGLIVDCSTSSADLARMMEDKLKPKGIGILDAPISGGPEGAKNGTLSIMVGGEKEIFDRALLVLQAMGQKITWVGPAGAGQLAKAVNQLIVGVNLAIVAEGIALARKSGIDPNRVLDAISEGAAKSWVLSMRGPMMLQEEFMPPRFALSLHAKDFRLAMEAARTADCTLEIASQVSAIFQQLEQEGKGNLDHSSIYQYVKKKNNL